MTTLASLDAKLDRVVRRHAELADTLAQPETAAGEFGVAAHHSVELGIE